MDTPPNIAYISACRAQIARQHAPSNAAAALAAVLRAEALLSEHRGEPGGGVAAALAALGPYYTPPGGWVSRCCLASMLQTHCGCRTCYTYTPPLGRRKTRTMFLPLRVVPTSRDAMISAAAAGGGGEGPTPRPLGHLQ